MDGIIKNLKNPQITADIVLKIYKEKGSYSGFVWVGTIDLSPNEGVQTQQFVKTYLLIMKHLITGQVFGTPIMVSTDVGGVGYAPVVEKTTRLTDLE